MYHTMLCRGAWAIGTTKTMYVRRLFSQQAACCLIDTEKFPTPVPATAQTGVPNTEMMMTPHTADNPVNFIKRCRNELGSHKRGLVRRT